MWILTHIRIFLDLQKIFTYVWDIAQFIFLFLTPPNSFSSIKNHTFPGCSTPAQNSELICNLRSQLAMNCLEILSTHLCLRSKNVVIASYYDVTLFHSTVNSASKKGPRSPKSRGPGPRGCPENGVTRPLYSKGQRPPGYWRFGQRFCQTPSSSLEFTITENL